MPKADIIGYARDFDMAGFAEWLKDRPEVVKNLAQQFPPNAIYRMKKGAPYNASSAGALVLILGYNDEDPRYDLIVVVAGNLDGRAGPRGEPAPGPLQVRVDHRYVEPVTVEEAFKTLN